MTAPDPADRPTARPADRLHTPGLPVAAVARRLGVAPATLRTWDRRYGLGPSSHAAGAHRRYGPDDLARLEVMQRLTREGVAPVEAARHALDGTSSDTGDAAAAPAPGAAGPVPSHSGVEAVVRGLNRAALALDSETMRTTVLQQLAQHGVVRTWEHVLRPVLVAAGDRWASTGQGVEVEHLLADCLTSAFQQIARDLPTTSPARPVLLAGAPDEQHALPLHAMAAGLAEHGVACRVLGPAMPVRALEDAVRRTGASALFLWSQLPRTGDPRTLDALPVTRPRTVVVAGGPGWVRESLSPRITYAEDLRGAIDLVLAASGH